MAVDAPTVDEILTRFPTLESQAELIEAILPEAISQVDERWRTQDQKPAIMYLAAHMATVEADAGGGVGGAGVAVGNIASEGIGSLSVSYGNGGGSSSSATVNAYLSTIYGRRYWDLLQKNFPKVVVAEVDVVGVPHHRAKDWPNWDY